MNLSIGNEEPNDPSSSGVKARLDALLTSVPIEWNVVNGLLQELPVFPSSKSRYASCEDDPLGRLFVSKLISRNPPAEAVATALRAYPDSLSQNPAVFFTACRDSTPKVVAQLTSHLVRTNSTKNECPYPWILSNHVSIDGAKAMLQVYPQGVLQPSSVLSSFSPLDFFLMSNEMIAQRNFDMTLWSKFKLMLVAAECCEQQPSSNGLSPVHMILKRVVTRSDFLDNMERARHVLWLLQQLRCNDRWVFQKQGPGGLHPLQFVLSHVCTEDRSGLVAARELVKILLSAHPESARLTVNGRLAIHMAVENGWPCHDLLLSIYPEALDIPDPATELVPFQAAARSDYAGLSLDVTYELFRANPVHVDRRMQKPGSRVGAQA